MTINNLPARLRDPEQYTDAADEAARFMERVAECALSMTGHTTDFDETIEQWRAEREALAQFHAENTFLKGENERLADLMVVAEKTADVLRGEMFVSDALRKLADGIDQAVKSVKTYRNHHHLNSEEDNQ